MRGKVNEAEFKVLLVEHPQAKDSFFAEHFHVSNEAIRKRRRKLEKRLDAIVQGSNQDKLGEVVNATKNNLEKDIEELRRIALKELQVAIDGKDRRGMLDWYDKATANAKLRIDISKSLNVLIDNRSVNIVNVVGEDLIACLCPMCLEKVKAYLLKRP
jgi:hypothetical protein